MRFLAIHLTADVTVVVPSIEEARAVLADLQALAGRINGPLTDTHIHVQFYRGPDYLVVVDDQDHPVDIYEAKG